MSAHFCGAGTPEISSRLQRFVKFSLQRNSDIRLPSVLEQLSRGLQTLGFIMVGGADWNSGEGTRVVTNSADLLKNGTEAWALGFGQGARIARLAVALKTSNPGPGHA